MKRINIKICMVLLLMFFNPVLYVNSFAQKPIKLFNGKNLKGWYSYLEKRGKDQDPKKVFTVEKGMIRISGEEYGCITTNDEFKDYKLTVEFKWGEKTFEPRIDRARDGGVLIHSQGADGGYRGIWMNSIECQLIEGGSGDIIVVGDGTDQFTVTSPIVVASNGGYVYNPKGTATTLKGGRVDWFGRDPNWKDEINFRGKNDVEHKLGEWNKLECVAVGGSIDIYLNGVLVNQAMNVKPRSGKIQIQSEGAEMFIRKVELIPADKMGVN